MLAALNTQRPTVGQDSLKRYEDFTKKFGQDGA